MSSKVLMLLPDRDFDVSETSVPWHILRTGGVKVEFATESGNAGQCDPLLLTGVIFGKLGATEEVKNLYSHLITTPDFLKPHRFDQVNLFDYDAIILPGGHAQGMKPYLENTTIRDKIIPFINDPKKIVAAVCHGVIVLARTTDPSTGKSVLYRRKSTCLPKYMEKSAYYLTAWKHGRYYRTYDQYVEDEVKAAMEKPSEQFQPGTSNYFASLDDKYAFVSVDGNYISARWPGDVYLFGQTILKKLTERY